MIAFKPEATVFCLTHELMRQTAARERWLLSLIGVRIVRQGWVKHILEPVAGLRVLLRVEKIERVGQGSRLMDSDPG